MPNHIAHKVKYNIIAPNIASINKGIITKIRTTTNLVNPSVTEGMGRLRTLTRGTRAARTNIVDIATMISKHRVHNFTTIELHRTHIARSDKK